jgi:hypothetical protein
LFSWPEYVWTTYHFIAMDRSDRSLGLASSRAPLAGLFAAACM